MFIAMQYSKKSGNTKYVGPAVTPYPAKRKKPIATTRSRKNLEIRTDAEFKKSPRQLDPTRINEDVEALKANLHERIVGQEEAIREVVQVYQKYLAGLHALDRPVGNLFFLGPTGSGKTRLVEATAEALVGDARAVIKIDCAEFRHSHEVAKLIGSPPGYLGHRETFPLLSPEVLSQYHTKKVKLSFVLFDEIDKASDALWSLLLGILDKATLTLGDNRQVDFSRTIIFMTANSGAKEMAALVSPSMGFAKASAIDTQLAERVKSAGLNAVRHQFTPEFINRLDKVVVFRSLGEAELRQILDIELTMVQRRVLANAENVPFLFRLTDAAKNYLLREGTDHTYGARHLKRAIEQHLVFPLSNLISTRQVEKGDIIEADIMEQASNFLFTRVMEGVFVPAIQAEVKLLQPGKLLWRSLARPKPGSAKAIAKKAIAKAVSKRGA